MLGSKQEQQLEIHNNLSKKGIKSQDAESALTDIIFEV